ncbi:DUF192 domain-containing protein [Candidatus Woesearchaeota archaeon]|nr:DUF192 domain-containing protein [Candidatus Woesearchaeota archaeon]
MTKTGVINKSRKYVLSGDFKRCCSILSKAKGLMFTNRSEVLRRAYVFEFSKPLFQSMHMMFVVYPIDILFLDEDKRVVDLVEGLKPFRFYNSIERAMYVVELPNSMIKRSGTRIGDDIVW